VVLAGALTEAHVQKILGQKIVRENDSVVCYIYYFLKNNINNKADAKY
jgi:hypothetical protein